MHLKCIRIFLEMGDLISIFLHIKKALFDCCIIITAFHPTQKQISSCRLLFRPPTEKPREGELRARQSLFLLEIVRALVEAAYKKI